MRSIATTQITRHDDAVTGRARILLLALLTSSACVNGYTQNRGLHYIETREGDEQLVRTSPPPPRAYEAYLRARLALERDPPQLDAAREQVWIALRWQPNDPQLWTLLAEIEWRAGALDEAGAALEQALDLRPGYREALELQAQLAGPKASARAQASEASHRAE